MTKTGSKQSAHDNDGPDGMRKDMREFHRTYMLTIWLFVGFCGTIGVILWAALYFSGG
jgi:hypothetical protein